MIVESTFGQARFALRGGRNRDLIVGQLGNWAPMRREQPPPAAPSAEKIPRLGNPLAKSLHNPSKVGSEHVSNGTRGAVGAGPRASSAAFIAARSGFAPLPSLTAASRDFSNASFSLL